MFIVILLREFLFGLSICVPYKAVYEVVSVAILTHCLCKTSCKTMQRSFRYIGSMLPFAYVAYPYRDECVGKHFVCNRQIPTNFNSLAPCGANLYILYICRLFAATWGGQ